MRRARRRYRKNSVTRDDLLHIGLAAAAAFGIGMIIGKKSAIQETAAATAGLGAYFIDPMNIPINGIGHYVQVR